MTNCNASRSGGEAASPGRDEAAPTFDIVEDATIIRREHAAITELFMHTVDLFDQAQRDGNLVNMPVFRKATGRVMRGSAGRLSLALAALVLKDAPELADELCDYVESIDPAEQGTDGGDD